MCSYVGGVYFMGGPTKIHDLCYTNWFVKQNDQRVNLISQAVMV
jgi:hypothetical protein